MSERPIRSPCFVSGSITFLRSVRPSQVGLRGAAYKAHGACARHVHGQEFLLGEAEDVGLVISLGETVTVPYGTFTDCLQTEDFSPLEPGVFERKFYAPGIGVILEIDLESGERTELIEIIDS